MKRYAIAILALFFTIALFAEDKVPPKFVRVTGTAEVKVVPDRVVIDVGVEKHSPSAITAKQLADATSRKLLSVVREAGIDAKDVQTTNLSLQSQTEYSQKQRIHYFSAEQTLSVTVRDITKLDSILESLVKAGGNQINSIQYEVSDLRKCRDQARDLAAKAAREKAQALAHALGQEIGNPLTIDESPEAANPFYAGLAPNVMIGSLAMDKMAAPPPPPSTAAGQNTVTATVVIAFELK